MNRAEIARRFGLTAQDLEMKDEAVLARMERMNQLGVPLTYAEAAALMEKEKNNDAE